MAGVFRLKIVAGLEATSEQYKNEFMMRFFLDIEHFALP